MRDIRRIIRLGFLLVLLGLIAAAVSGSASGGATAASGNGPDPALVQKLKDKARGSVALSEKQATKHIGFVRAGQNGDLLPGNSGKAEVKAKDFLREYGAILGAGSESTLDEISSSTDSLGGTHVTYQQFYKGVPVWAGTIRRTRTRGQSDRDQRRRCAGYHAQHDAAAQRRRGRQSAIATVVADPPSNEKTGQRRLALRQRPSRLVGEALRLPARSAEGRRGHEPARLRGRGDQRPERARRRLRPRALGQGRQPLLGDHGRACTACSTSRTRPRTPVWQEGDPFPGALNGDQQNIVTFSGNSYYHFFNAFGRDSYDGARRDHEDRSTTTRRSTARTPTGTARRRTTATASPPTTSSRTSGAMPTRSSRTT